VEANQLVPKNAKLKCSKIFQTQKYKIKMPQKFPVLQ
jgi:hypothetical protein